MEYLYFPQVSKVTISLLPPNLQSKSAHNSFTFVSERKEWRKLYERGNWGEMAKGMEWKMECCFDGSKRHKERKKLLSFRRMEWAHYDIFLPSIDILGLAVHIPCIELSPRWFSLQTQVTCPTNSGKDTAEAMRWPHAIWNVPNLYTGRKAAT